MFCLSSFRLQETMDRLAAQLELVYNAAGGKKINLISHSMGGILVKCFMCLHSDVIHLFSYSNQFYFFFVISYNLVIYTHQLPFTHTNLGINSLLKCKVHHNFVLVIFRFLRNMLRIGLQLLHHSKVSSSILNLLKI